MTIDDKIIDEKIQYNINRESAKISALSSGKTDKYEYITGEEILPSDKSTITEQDKFTYFLLGKAFEKQIKTLEDQWTQQVKDLKALKPKENKEEIKSTGKGMRINEIKNENYDIKNWEDKIKWKNLKYKTKNYTYDFQQDKTVIAEAEENQSNLLKI